MIRCSVTYILQLTESNIYIFFSSRGGGFNQVASVVVYHSRIRKIHWKPIREEKSVVVDWAENGDRRCDITEKVIKDLDSNGIVSIGLQAANISVTI